MVLITRTPSWLVEGVGTPSLALYSDGLLIYANRKTEFPPLLSVVLNRSEMAELLNWVPRGKALADLSAKVKFYRPGRPSNRICRWDDNRKLVTGWAPGDLDTKSQKDLEAELAKGGHDARRRAALEEDLAKARKERRGAPPSFLAVYDSLLAFEHPRATAYLPAHVEVVICPWEDGPVPTPEPEGWVHIVDKEPIPWPKTWPGLDDPRSRPIKEDNDIHELWVPGEHLRALTEMSGRISSLDGRLSETSARELGRDDRQWKHWMHRIRIPFPSEESWRPW